MSLPADHDVRMRRARLALDGLSVGDAFGERFFVVPGAIERVLEARILPEAPWEHTDETAMALAILGVLERHGTIDRDVLAQSLGARYQRDPARGYEQLSHWILASIAAGVPWSEAAESVLDGAGSMGNEAAARVAPVGAYFADDLDAVVREARASAEPTHAHAEAHAGAIAVAIAAALAARMGAGQLGASGAALLDGTLARTPFGATRDGIERARVLFAQDASIDAAASTLGVGAKVLASDTVPFALFCAARSLSDFADAMWTTVSGLGDRDTTCAIVGGIVALAGGERAIPAAWLMAREPLQH